MLIRALAGFLPVVPVLAVYHLVLSRNDKKKGIKAPKSHIAGVYLFCFVLALVLSITGVPGIYDLSINANLNLKLFAYFPVMYYQYIANALLFVPVGFLLPLLWKRFEKWQLTLLYGFVLSATIEFSQLFNYRITDVDDLFMNTLGTMIGFLVFAIVKKGSPRVSAFSIGYRSHWKGEPVFCFFIVWISVLVFKPILSGYLLGLAFPFVSGAPG